jgi:hypothetical protein
MLAGEWKAVEETASTQSSEIDLRILDWTIGALGDDDALEKFLESIPGFCNSLMTKNLKRPLPYIVSRKFVDSIGRFLTRSLSSNSVSEEVKIRRLDICMNAAKAICDFDDIMHILFRLLDQPLDQLPLSFRTACENLWRMSFGTTSYMVTMCYSGHFDSHDSPTRSRRSGLVVPAGTERHSREEMLGMAGGLWAG